MSNSSQTCPECGSSRIRTADSISRLGNPLLAEAMVGWECMDCGYIGKDFFITDEKKPKEKGKIRNKNNKK